MPSSKRLVLLNAEPFGFGPSSAIANIALKLHEANVELRYIGERHTLDLQKALPYQKVYDITHLSEEERVTLLKKLQPECDLFLTAMDTTMAKQAKKVGLRTAVYDALAWYWPKLSSGIQNCDLYLAQNFFGVKERLIGADLRTPKTIIVPPIVHPKQRAATATKILVNLGGLQNPLWSVEQTVQYARLMLDTVKAALPNEELTICTSSAVAKGLDDINTHVYSRSEMIRILEDTKYAIMTPGLGNIYEAAAYQIPTLWLPPANDSQGQQLDLLFEHNVADARIDWGDVTGKINYRQP